jgi:hypothetical protein
MLSPTKAQRYRATLRHPRKKLAPEPSTVRALPHARQKTKQANRCAPGEGVRERARQKANTKRTRRPAGDRVSVTGHKHRPIWNAHTRKKL